jgi:hypothetical protein
MVLKPAAPTPAQPPLSVAALVAHIRAALFGLPDHRKGGNNQTYAIGDAGLSAFSVFFLQSPSFLDYQRRMQKEHGSNNANTLFGVHQIPSTQQICNLLDPVAPAHLAPVFMDVADALQQRGALHAHRSADGRLLIALDGIEYHCSGSVHCPHCSTRTLSNGQTQYYHVAVTPVIVAPGQTTVFPLAPEFVRPQDGHLKQDCELMAATRWLHQWGARIAPWGTTLLGDDLYCHQPFCAQVLAHGCAFLFVCLPPSHALLYEWVADFERTGEVPSLVKTRWTGKQHLAALLASLILLAFLAHTVLDLPDPRYQAVRRHLPSRQTFFEHLRALTQYLLFASWDHLFDFMLEALQPAQPPPGRRSRWTRRQI